MIIGMTSHSVVSRLRLPSALRAALRVLLGPSISIGGSPVGRGRAACCGSTPDRRAQRNIPPTVEWPNHAAPVGNHRPGMKVMTNAMGGSHDDPPEGHDLRNAFPLPNEALDECWRADKRGQWIPIAHISASSSRGSFARNSSDRPSRTTAV
jgi:hypothetical protein